MIQIQEKKASVMFTNGRLILQIWLILILILFLIETLKIGSIYKECSKN